MGLLWIDSCSCHAGGFVAGKYSAPNAWVVPGFTSRGYHVVSVAYRFMPQASLEDIIRDCADAFAWCRANLESLLGDAIDLDRYVVTGDSAGGYLSAQMPFELNPAPSALVLVYALVDFHSSSLNRKRSPSAEPTYHRPRTTGILAAAATDHDLSHADFFCPWDGDLPPGIDIAKTRSFLGMPEYQVTDRHLLRLDLNKYMVSTGFNRLDELFRRKPGTADEEFETQLRSRSPFFELETVQTYPPTFFLHGSRDSLVGISQADRMAEKLEQKGVPIGQAYDFEGEHCFEIFISVGQYPDLRAF